MNDLTECFTVMRTLEKKKNPSKKNKIKYRIL